MNPLTFLPLYLSIHCLHGPVSSKNILLDEQENIFLNLDEGSGMVEEYENHLGKKTLVK